MAVPVALVAAAVAFLVLHRPGTGTPAPGASSGRPRATSPVPMTAPSLTARQATVCRALLSRLPDEVGPGLARRPVTAGPEQNAAYGEPPVLLSCGGTDQPIAPDATVYPLGGVCWYGERAGDATVFRTVDREVPVRVTVPAAYQGQLIVSFSAPVAAAVPTLAHVPAGC